MKNNFLLALMILLSPVLFAREHGGTHPGIGRTPVDSVADLRAAVEARPDSLALHQRFIDAFRKSIPGVNYTNYDSVLSLLKPQYEEWMKRWPKLAAVPFALGHAFANAESPAAKPYLLKAVALDPKMGEAWEDLSEAHDRSWLQAVVLAQGIQHYLWAIRVRWLDGIQRADSDSDAATFAGLRETSDATGAFQTIRLFGAHYVLGLVPAYL